MSVKEEWERAGFTAFPVWDRHETVYLGMTLRDYFIAHAPAEPQPWFAPVLTPRPTPTYISEDGNFKSFSVTEMERRFGDCFLMANRSDVSAWDADAVKQRYVQWPAAWADAMLDARQA